MITEAAALDLAAGRVLRPAATGFDEAYAAMHRSAYRVAYRLLGSREEASDVAQEACARAYSRWDKVQRLDSADAWVARVAGNLAIDVWRRHKTADKYAGRLAGSGAHVDAERVDLHRALGTLPRRQRQVVLLRFVADMPEAAVASALGCSVGSVKAHASRGLAALRATLTEDE
jgi:RNA polymerase sigma-70 factor (sigma-E family)